MRMLLEASCGDRRQLADGELQRLRSSDGPSDGRRVSEDQRPVRLAESESV